jgi:hypothetical protein
MKIETIALPIFLAAALGSTKSDAFVVRNPVKPLPVQRKGFVQPTTFRQAANIDAVGPDDEVERLRSMAKKLRDEASALAAEQAVKVSESTQKVFDKFDLNTDGAIDPEELKLGLEKVFKIELSDQRVKQLISKFDQNGDGVLQLQEFVSVDQMRNQLDALVREEKALALEQSKLAQQEEEAQRLYEMQMSVLNDGAPTPTEKAISVLPYLFPLLDSLQYAGPYITQHPDNPLAQVAAVLYTLYRSIPGGGFLAFFALSLLGSNPSLNRLIRFNMQQAIYLDFSLFIPAVFSLLIGFAASGLDLNISTQLQEISCDAVVLGMFTSILYASASSLLGQEPDKVPFISKTVEKRMITPEMFDIQGQFLDRRKDEKDEESEK